LENGYLEVPISARHAIAVEDLPGLHKDTFDRLLIAQAKVEAFTLVTGDATLASYPGNIQLV
jgi:PIN domain nuclease of toxin-antitoxin system